MKDLAAAIASMAKRAAAEAELRHGGWVPSPKPKPKRSQRGGHNFWGNNCLACGAGKATARGNAPCQIKGGQMTALSTDWQGKPLESRNCEFCGEETAVSENTLDETGFRCAYCRVVAAHRAKGCTHAMTEWCPLRGPDPFVNLGEPA